VLLGHERSFALVEMRPPAKLSHSGGRSLRRLHHQQRV
jgi:hypothetical protein